MPETCSVCTKAITNSRFPGVNCSNCRKAYHNNCGNISEALYKSLLNGSAAWFCQTCHVDTHTSIIQSDDTGSVPIPTNPTLSDVIIILKSMQHKLDEFEKSQKFVCASLDDINVTIKLLSKENQQLKQHLNQLEDNYRKQEYRLNALEAQADVQNQLACKNSVVICGLNVLPNKEDVNQEEIIKILTKVDQNISPNCINSITKMYHKKNSASRLKDSFIINFKTTQLKNDLLLAFRKHKSSNTQNEIKSLNIMHYFTKYQSRLYKEAKRIQATFGFSFLWCKDGKIFLRKSQDSEVHHIFSFNDTSRIHSGFRILDSQGNNSSVTN